MEMIGSDDADKVDRVFPLALLLHHFFIICVSAVGAYAIGHAGLARSFRILTKRSGHQFDGPIQLGRHAMYGTNKGARATTHHPHTKTSTVLHFIFASDSSDSRPRISRPLRDFLVSTQDCPPGLFGVPSGLYLRSVLVSTAGVHAKAFWLSRGRVMLE